MIRYIRDKLAVFAGQETYKQLQQKLTETENKVKELEAQLQTGNATGELKSLIKNSCIEQLKINRGEHITICN